MSEFKRVEVIRGSGNAFKDLGIANADVEQSKAILAARIISLLDEKLLSTRKAATLTEFQQADFARIRKVQVSRFTIDKLVKMVNALDLEYEVFIDFRPRTAVLAKGQRKNLR